VILYYRIYIYIHEREREREKSTDIQYLYIKKIHMHKSIGKRKKDEKSNIYYFAL